MEERYKDYLKYINDAESFNRNLSRDRGSRLPFIDTQTGVAQSDCLLWRSVEERRRLGSTSKTPTNQQLYTYPAIRWQKNRRDYLLSSLPRNSNNHSVKQISLLNNRHQHIVTTTTTPTTTTTTTTNSRTTNQLNGGQVVASIVNNYEQQHYNVNKNLSLLNHPHQPARADSTGSHSCNTVDSDLSRDLSIAASSHSSSFDSNNSPRSTRDLIIDSDEQSSLGVGSHDSLATFGETLLAKPDNNGQQQLKCADRQQQNSLADGVISIKKKKKKDVGQSLINKQTTSILVKNGRTTNNNKSSSSSSSSLLINDGLSNQSKLNQNDEQQNMIKTKIIKDNKEELDRSTKQAIIVNGSSRPYVCSICNQSYKTRPGLSYHFIHSHNLILPKNLPHDRITFSNNHHQLNVTTKTTRSSINKRKCSKGQFGDLNGLATQESIKGMGDDSTKIEYKDGEHFEDEDEEEQEEEDDDRILNKRKSNKFSFECQEQLKLNCYHDNNHTKNNQKFDFDTNNSINDNKNTKKISKSNPFCDFCLGNVEKNRRTRLPEELISCTCCGSSGHPSCLRFSENILKSVKKYDWQCIECKTCSNCNNADREDQLLFCDDCDRSYHTYCLNPPLTELPEGNWNCQLCQLEYHS